MHRTSLADKLAALRLKVIDKFSRSCVEGACAALGDQTNPLRFHSFADAIRALFEHTMDVHAPVDAVRKCVWYRPETNDGRPTQAQRITYAIQGGLSDDFVVRELGVELKGLRKSLLDAVDWCTEQRHALECSPVTDASQQETMVVATIDAVTALFDAFFFCREAIVEPLIESLDKVAVCVLVDEALRASNIMEPRWSVEDVCIEKTDVREISHESITYRSSGSVGVMSQFPLNAALNNDIAAALSDRFNFSCDIEVGVSQPWDVARGKARNFHVDASQSHAARGRDYWNEN